MTDHRNLMTPLGHLPHQAPVHHVMAMRVRGENRQNVGRLDGDEAAPHREQPPRKTHLDPLSLILPRSIGTKARQSRWFPEELPNGCCRLRRPTTTVRSPKIFFDRLIGLSAGVCM